MCPLTAPDRHDAPGLLHEPVPGLAAMLEDVVVGCEDAVGEPVVAHELPNIFRRIELGAFWRQRDNGDVFRNTEFVRGVPAGLIHQQHAMGIGRYGLRYFGQMERHGLRVADRQDQTGPFAKLRADGPKDVG